MTNPTDATKLPEHIRFMGHLGSYRICREDTIDICVPSRISSADLRAIAADMDAQAGRTAAPVVTEDMVNAAIVAERAARKDNENPYQQMRHAILAALRAIRWGQR